MRSRLRYVEGVSESEGGRKLNWALGGALVAALLVIAFLLGRESSRVAPAERHEPVADEGEVEAGTVLPTETAELPFRGNEPFSWEETDELEEGSDAAQTGAARIERKPDGTIVLSNVRRGDDGGDSGAPPDNSRAPSLSTAPASIDAYFARLDAVRTEDEATQPKSFAMGMLRAAMSGNTEGFDRLIEDAEEMEAEIETIAPPPSCQRFHESTLDALEESREVLENLREAIARQDVQGIMQVAARARALQAKTTELKAMEDSLRGR